MIPWPKIGTFLLKEFKTILVSIGVVFLFWQLKGWYSDYQELKDEQEQKTLQLTTQRNAALVKAASAEATLAEKIANDERMELLRAETEAQIAEVRAEAQEQKDVFEGHDFQALTDAKPGLIEKLANKATQERFDAFEEAFNRK